jgi:hypothetical protein
MQTEIDGLGDRGHAQAPGMARLLAKAPNGERQCRAFQ